MTIEEIKAKLPPEFQPIVDQYGPSLLAMSVADLWAWIDLLAKGDSAGAYKTLLSKLPNADLFAEANKLLDDWQKANEANKARVELQKAAATAVLKVCLAIALAAVGL